MPRYYCVVPIAGHYWVELEADSVEDAKEKALAEWPFDPDFTIREGFEADLSEIESYDRLFEGNVSYVRHTKIEVDEIKDDY